MANINKRIKKVLRTLGKVVLITAIIFTTLLGGTIVSLQFPYVQTKIVKKAATYFSSIIHHDVKVEKVSISWFDIIHLKNLKVIDHEQNEMIFLKDAAVDFRIESLLNPTIIVDEITLSDGMVRVIRNESGTNINGLINNIRDLQPERDPGKPPVPFNVENVSLKNMAFSYDDNRKGYISEGFDHYHFGFTDIYASASNLKVVADTFALDVTDLDTKEVSSGLGIRRSSVNFMLNKSEMEFSDLDFNVGKSKVKDYLKFEYATIDDLSEFIEKVNITASLKDSRVTTPDLAHFAPTLKKYTDQALVSGDVKGTIENLQVKNLNFSFGKNSSVSGQIDLKGLPDIDNTSMILRFENSKVSSVDLGPYLSDPVNESLGKFGTFSGSGEFTGFPDDFVARGDFKTALGKIQSDLKFEIVDGKTSSSRYSGTITTSEFDLGKFLGEEEILQKVDMKGSVSGSGFNLNNADIKVNADISRIGIYNYNYSNIKTNARLSGEMFSGKLSVSDPNITFTTNGTIDFRNNTNLFNIRAAIEKANLKHLNLTEKETFIVGNLDLNFKGLNPDDIVGSANISNTYLLYEGNKELFIDRFSAESHKDGEERSLNVSSDLFDLEASGNFEFSSLYLDIQELYKEYRLNIKNDSLEIVNYYNEKRKLPAGREYKILFDVNAKEINNLLAVYVPGLYLSEGVQVQGELKKGPNSMISMFTHVDTLFYQEHELINTDIELNSSKLRDSSNMLGMAYLISEKQTFQGLPETEGMMIHTVWEDSMVYFETNISQSESSNTVFLKGDMSLRENNKQVITFRDSYLNLMEEQWIIPENNRINIERSEIYLDNVKLQNDSQMIGLQGFISEEPLRELKVDVHKFQVSNVNPLTEETDFAGELDGKLVLRDLYNAVNFGGDISLESFKLDNFLVGDVKGKAGWDFEHDRLKMDVQVNRENERIISLTGNINDIHKDHKLDLQARLHDARLEILSPVLKGVLSEVSGNATGDLRIVGSLNNIIPRGMVKVEEGTFKVDYLGTTYFFNDYVVLDTGLVGFKAFSSGSSQLTDNFRLLDSHGGYTTLYGGLYHDNFDEWIVNLKGEMNNLQVLNTSAKDNELFYGNAYMSGNFEFLGSFYDLKINIPNGVSEKGSKIYIPLSGTETNTPQDYIKFSSPTDTGNVAINKKNKVDLNGIKMDFNLEVTPDTYVEIIFDKRAGDIIRGNGYGNLRLDIDTRGDFHMYGDYNITRGAYNFTLANVINKEFSIEPNSTIRWFGDPYKGILDITAKYDQMVSLKPLDSTLAGQRYPAHVLLGIEGPLNAPEIALDIDIEDYGAPQQATDLVAGFESRIKNNEQELNKHVFSLLVMGGLAPGTINAVGSGTVTNSVSELLTNQLGNWLSQVDDNLEIDLDLNGLDKEALNTFNLRLSYTMLDGRLRISRDGRFTNFDNANESSISNIAGEWNLEYLLTQEGKLRLNLYNKNNQSQLLSGVGSNTSSAGFSLMFTESFDSIKDIFRRKKKKRTKKEKEAPEPQIDLQESNPYRKETAPEEEKEKEKTPATSRRETGFRNED